MQTVCPNCSTKNPIDNKLCGGCGALLENASVVAEARQTEAGARNASEEIAYFASADVLITSKRAVFGNKTYVMANITSVSAVFMKAQRFWGAIAVVLGIAVFIYWLNQLWRPGWLMQSSDYFIVAIGVILVGGGAFLAARAKPRCTIQIASSSGEAQALTSTDRDYIERIVAAMEEAIAERG